MYKQVLAVIILFITAILAGCSSGGTNCNQCYGTGNPIPTPPTPEPERHLLNRCYGLRGDDRGYSIIETSDGCLAMAGISSTMQRGDADVWILKIDPTIADIEESVVFSQTYGGSLEDWCYSMIETHDKHLAVTGYTYSTDGDLTGVTHQGEADLWVLKINPDPNIPKNDTIAFNQCYGGSGVDRGSSIIETHDRYLAIAGYTDSNNNGDVQGNHGQNDAWILKINPDKTIPRIDTIEFKNCYGGNRGDWAYDIIETNDRYLAITGETFSNNGNLQSNNGECDLWVFKINPDKTIPNRDATVIFSHNYGSSAIDFGYRIIETKDGCLAIAGRADSNNGDLVNAEHHGGPDLWVLKIDPAVAADPAATDRGIVFNYCYGGADDDNSRDIIETEDGCLALTGYTFSTDGDLTGKGNHGDADLWILKIDPTIANRTQGIVFNRCYGGSGYDRGEKLVETNDKCLAVTGYTNSNDGDVSGNHGDNDLWVLKIDKNGNYTN